MKALSTGFLVLLATLSVTPTAAPSVPKLPTEYREWTHVKSMLIHSDKHPLFAAFSGLHHVYANKIALQNMKAKSKYADGAILVFDLLQADEANGAYSEGAHKVIAVMQKDAKKFKDTGGWGFQAFKGGNAAEPVVTNAKDQCFGCHEAQKDSDFVFSAYRE